MSCPSQHLKWSEQKRTARKGMDEAARRKTKASRKYCCESSTQATITSVEEKEKVWTRDCCSERDMSVSKVYRTIDLKGSIPMSHI